MLSVLRPAAAQWHTRSLKPLTTNICHGRLPFLRSFRSSATVSAETAAALPTLSSEIEGSIYYDNVYPLKWFKWDLRYLLYRPSLASLQAKVKGDLLPPQTELPHNFLLQSIEPRVKDGGLFVHFKCTIPAHQTAKDVATKGSPASTAVSDVVEKISSHLQKHRPWYHISPIRAFQVKGHPFLDDLTGTYPTSRLKVDFLGPDLTMETLYKEFRTFGRIADISIPPPPKDGTPRFSMIQFVRVRSAASARNCIHGEFIGNTRLSVMYHIVPRTNMIWSWIKEHQKFTVPFLVASVFALFYAVFDPIRVFFVTNHVSRRYNVEDTALYNWLRRYAIARLPWAHRTQGSSDFGKLKGWREREEEVTRIHRWLSQPPETFLLLSGPRGCGKSDLIEEVVRDKKYKVIIDCQELVNAHNDNELLHVLSKQVGFYPVFSSFVNLSNVADSVVATTTGQKTGLSSSINSQINKILECVAFALHNLSRPHDFMSARKREAVGDASGQRDPSDIPVVVIDNYVVRNLKSQQQFWDQLAQWAALLAENHIAHVIFITSTVSAAKPLSKALPTRTLEVVTLSDASTDTAMQYLRHQLNISEEKEIPGLVEAVNVLGGRATDLELFLPKLRAGQSPKEAVDDLVSRAVVEVRKHAFGDEMEDARKIPWTPTQFWSVMEYLSKLDMVSYDSVIFSPLFNGDEGPVQAMEAAELIQLVHKNGRPYYIKPSRPLYRTAFQRLLADKPLAASMKFLTAKQLHDTAVSGIQKCEQELSELSRFLLTDRVGKEVTSRVNWLLKKIKSMQTQVEQLDREMAEAKNIFKLDLGEDPWHCIAEFDWKGLFAT